MTKPKSKAIKLAGKIKIILPVLGSRLYALGKKAYCLKRINAELSGMRQNISNQKLHSKLITPNSALIYK